MQHPGVDPRRQAERDKRDQEKSKKKQKKGGARVALGLAHSGSDTDSDSDESHCSDNSEQSVYDDEPEASVQAADVALASIFDGGPRTFDVGQARVAHRLHRGDRAEQANAQTAVG